MLHKIQEIIAQWWSGFTLRTRLMAGATLVSLLMSSFTFWAVNTIQIVPDLLLQVFANLVENALKFTPSGGRVMIRAYPVDNREQINLKDLYSPTPYPHSRLPNPMVRVEVSDTGIGINPEDQKAIFERFFRVVVKLG